MGPLGTEGTFTAAAEETMRILRNNSNELLTILSAVVNDPLYEWKKSAAKARARQEEDGEENTSKSRNGGAINAGAREIQEPEDNLTAMHAIARIKEKLQGYEEGASSEQLSIDGQVQLLINAARDPDNLCLLYNGWAAWM
jgi:ataxia telangiectasia mutated family protein